METIIGLLFVLLPVIFNLIGKKLEKSGKTAGAGKMRDIAKALGADEDDTIAKLLESKDDESEPAPVEVNEAQPRTFMNEAQPTVSRIPQKKVKPAVAVKNVPDKRKEKIDPKKLVVYSEIMKPKFTE